MYWPEWDDVHVALWAGIGGAFLGYEIGSLLDQRDETPPATQLIVRHVPEELTLTGWFWLGVHLWLRYRRRERQAH